MVLIEFDPEKDRINQAKHRVSLAAAAALFESAIVEDVDDRFDYDEVRMVARGLIAGTVYICVWIARGEFKRIISLRQADRKETNEYYKATGTKRD